MRLILFAQLVAAAPPFSLNQSPSRQFKLQVAGAVASESEICTGIGTDILSRGGSAADAVVATTLCVGVVGMYHSGIGGGGFMLVRAPNRTMYDVDFREAAPAAANDTMYDKNATASVFGGLSVGVPGELRGLQWLHERFGKLPWKEVVMPAANVARKGWIVGEDLARYMGFGNQTFLETDPNWALDFAPTGKLVRVGDRIKRKRYGATLETIAEQGPDVFYSGPMAKSMIDTIGQTGGIMTEADMAEYKIVIREPLTVTYRGFQLSSCGAPASGALALGILKIVEGFNDFGWQDTMNLSTHRLNEAFRFGYAQVSEYMSLNRVDSDSAASKTWRPIVCVGAGGVSKANAQLFVPSHHAIENQRFQNSQQLVLQPREPGDSKLRGARTGFGDRLRGDGHLNHEHHQPLFWLSRHGSDDGHNSQ
jgi:gamma-glutamyltranspeptidase/glutathione hydrolase